MGNPKQLGKEDYNFVYSRNALYDAPGWSGRAEGQPFFAQVQSRGPEHLVSPDEVTLPPYYPDCDEFRRDWAEYLNSVSFTDLEVGNILKRLEQEGLLENTVIFFMTDHGISQARGKQFLYDEGARIPFIVWAPKFLKPQVKAELINHIDVAATSLEWAGIEIPKYMDAKPLSNHHHHPREFVVSARDRCDETVDHIRSVRKGNLKYIKNYLPNRPYLQPCDYNDQKPWMVKLRKLDRQGKLNAAQKWVTAQTSPVEELYDLAADPFEINNLAEKNAYAAKLEEFRSLLSGWEKETGD